MPQICGMYLFPVFISDAKPEVQHITKMPEENVTETFYYNNTTEPEQAEYSGLIILWVFETIIWTLISVITLAYRLRFQHSLRYLYIKHRWDDQNYNKPIKLE